MTELLYLTDSYKKECVSKILSCVQKGNSWEIILEKTIFYPQGGGQPSDKGFIVGKKGKAVVKHVRMMEEDVVHECSVEGMFDKGEEVTCTIDWERRYENMKRHTAGHILHEAVMQVAPYLKPIKADHGDKPYIEYQGSIPMTETSQIEREANAIVKADKEIITTFVSLKELQERSSFVPEHLPKHKPLRIVEINGYNPISDGGTQIATTKEVEEITITSIENTEESVRVYYEIKSHEQKRSDSLQDTISSQTFISELIELEQQANQKPSLTEVSVDELKKLSQSMRSVPKEDKQRVGIVLNQVKQSLEALLSKKAKESGIVNEDWMDVTAPGIRPPVGHLHIVTQAIEEITEIFNKLGFTRVRHPEVDWDWYAFESLNMPPESPARDEWETFLINHTPGVKEVHTPGVRNIVLTPHTSNGQVREMEKGILPIRMINIAKCYRRQIDVSHTPMFHQFEGLYIDKNVSIGHLKGVLDYFAKAFFGPDRKTRIRPFHFQFTEPSFEVDISCGICNGKGCRLCKEGWLELGGAGMVHPVVLANGRIDTTFYNGFAFGWGVERCFMMKSGTQLDDIRVLYGNDVRFLEQF